MQKHTFVYLLTFLSSISMAFGQDTTITYPAGPEPIISIPDTWVEQPGYRVSLYNTAWPCDMANLNRSNTVVNAGLPRDAASEDIVVETIEMPFPVFSYTRNDNEVFVVGGTPFILDSYVSDIDGLPKGETKSEPHITKYNPMTGEQVRLLLDKGQTVNYIGGALIHENGYVYVISQSHLYKIEPSTMTISMSIDLPTAPFPNGQSTIYNGLSVNSAGYLLTKYFSLTSASSEFFVIDPLTLDILSTLEYPGASPRLALANYDGNEYLYHLNQSETFRLLVDDKFIQVDTTWLSKYDPYNTGEPENEEPTSPVIVNNIAHYTTNTTTQAPEAMKIFWQNVDRNYSLNDSPLQGEYLFEGASEGGFSFFHLSIDEETGIIIGNDQGNGLLTAVRVADDGSLERIWEKSYAVSARPAIVSDRRMVYATDFTGSHNDLIVLDLLTGDELIRVQTPATRATISTIVVSTNNEVYFGSNEPGERTGLYHRIYVKEAGPVSTKDLTVSNNLRVVPNPFQDQALVNWNNIYHATFQAQLLNVTGQVVRKYPKVTGESLLIEKGDLVPGIYFLNMIDGLGNFGTVKLLLQE